MWEGREKEKRGKTKGKLGIKENEIKRAKIKTRRVC
jgi:hypothetical protein